MRVALVSSGSGSRGGGEIYLRLLAEGLSAAGHDVHAIVPAAAPMDELAAGIAPFARVHRAALTPTYTRRLRNLAAVVDPMSQRRLRRVIAGIAPDIVHVNQQVAEDGLDLLRGAMATGLPVVSTVHIARSARTLGARFALARDAVTAAVLRRAAAAFIVVSEATRLQLAERLGPGPAIQVVHLGVPSVSRAQLASARKEARQDWGAGPDEVVVGCVGRIEVQKDPLRFVALGRMLRLAGRPVRLVWIGDGSMRPVLEQAAASGLDPVPLVVDRWRSDAATRLAGFDLFLLPSRYEGLPLALLEALHAGLPVVAAATDGIPEAIRSGETGFLCASETEWRETLLRLVDDAALRKRLGTAARRAAGTRFSLPAFAGRTLAVYEAALARRPGRAA